MTKRILTYEQAEIIRKWRKQDKKKYTHKYLMALFKISKSTCKEILRYKSYNSRDYKGRIKITEEQRYAMQNVIRSFPKFSRARGRVIRNIAKTHNLSTTIIRRIIK